MSEIHAAARLGFSREAQTYARGRPDYPAALLPWLTDALGVAPGKVVVDLGAGTGKFTKLLVATGAHVIAVEPVAAMRAQLAAILPAVQQLPGTAEAIPLAEAAADALVCAQAFHWFATELALAEIRRVLRPGGRLGLIWNVRDESVDWVATISEIITPYEGDARATAKVPGAKHFPANTSPNRSSRHSPISMSGRHRRWFSIGSCPSASSPRCRRKRRPTSRASCVR